MRAATLMIGIIAILMALAGSYALRVYMQPVAPEVVAEPPVPRLRPVPVASLELPAGRVVQFGDVGLMSKEAVNDLPGNAMQNPDDIIGRMLAKPMQPNEPFVTTNLYPEGEGPDLSERLKPGFRAMTVEISSLDTVGGYVVPGSIVDVLFRSQRRKGQDGYDDVPEVTVMLAEGVEVVAVGKNPAAPRPDQAEEGEPSILVTLACRPDAASKLRAVVGRGEFSLALWAQEDGEHNVSVKKGTTLEDVLGIGPGKKAVQTEIYRRGRRSINTFEERRTDGPVGTLFTNTTADAAPNAVQQLSSSASPSDAP